MRTKPGCSHYDAIIVGARCAGASTAMLLARAGMRVLAVDRRAYGSDTLSTHALMRPAVLQLSRWGLLKRLLDAGTPLITATAFHYGDQEITIPLRASPQLPGLIAPRRTLLDRTLVDAAREAGAEVLHDTVVGDLVSGADARVRGVKMLTSDGTHLTVTADIVIGADGIGSLVAKRCGAQTLRRGQVSAAHLYAYVPIEPESSYRWYFREGVSGSFIPTNDGLACIVASVPTEHFDERFRGSHEDARLAVLRSLSPDLGAQAERAHVDGAIDGGIRVFRGVPGFLRQAYGPGWALVGDAGFFRDPITSHGISDALRDSESLARTILDGSAQAFASYQRERDFIAEQILDATDTIASFDWTLGDIETRHRQFSSVMKAEFEGIVERDMQARRFPRPWWQQRAEALRSA
ncbi:FAD-binding monooxygenase [Mesorhizobium sp. LNJC399B00]|uniref:NAD(P)/FAD-dependent oxidoreductase n=1 Tax=unclassified Mesorhizobium TaxID=325217 RepID=UPI0003CE55C9|nr:MULTISPECIES: NAD(P)/FAD-dependent oxidoreductase [unclassified Mesorhizobium]ESY07306.1 FAD-binding monooxygenase [Mesorhizobium sp. LNJC399B00]WJI70599.1 NAD(P)/FAD-dependent oxidoreductase [Mesorhizobium sp. C399B]